MREQIEELVRRLLDEGRLTHDRLSRIDRWELVVYDQGDPWTVRDVVAHLVAAERGHQKIIASVAAGDAGAPAGVDIDRYNAESVQQLAAWSPERLVIDVASVRDETVRLVRGLTDADLGRRGRHPVLGETALLVDMIRLVPLHVRMHLRDLQRALA